MGTYLAVVLAVFVTFTVVSILGQHAFLRKLYNENKNLMLDETTSTRRSSLYFIGGLFYAIIFVFLAKGLALYDMTMTDGFAFGLLMGLAVTVPHLVNQYATYALPAKLLIGQAVISIIQNLTAGIVVGWFL